MRKSQIQALDRTQPIQPMRPGQVERRTHNYKRHGTTTLFAALDTKSGQVIGETHARHRSVEFRKFLDRIDASVPGRVVDAAQEILAEALASGVILGVIAPEKLATDGKSTKAAAKRPGG
jgi:hypothetical protein